MPIDDQLVQIANILKIQPQWLADPYLFVINIMIPVALNSVAFYFILKRVVIKSGGIPAGILAAVLAVLAMSVGSLVIYFSPLIISILAMQRWSNRIIFLDVFYTLVFLILPSVAKFEFPQLTTMALWLVPTMFGIVAKIEKWQRKIIFIAIVIAIWLYVLPLIQNIR